MDALEPVRITAVIKSFVLLFSIFSACNCPSLLIAKIRSVFLNFYTQVLSDISL